MFLVNSSRGFIPDSCNVLKKYNLVTILNAFISDSHTLPKKCTWKNIVNNAITLSETILWNQRTSADDEFLLFRIVHPVIQPCIIYKVFKEGMSVTLLELRVYSFRLNVLFGTYNP